MTASANRARLNATVRQGQDWTAVRLTGVIDEHNGLRNLTEQLGHKLLLVDLSGVRRINSVGVRDWVNWLAELRAKDVRTVLFDCPPGIMDQVNLVRNFAEGAVIETFLAPYYCDRCDREENYRIDTFELMATSDRRAPTFHCDKSACGMALDDVEENYFAFLADQRVPSDLEQLKARTKAARAALDAGEGDAAPLTNAEKTGDSALAKLSGQPLPTGLAAELARPPAPQPVEIKKRGDVLFYLIILVMLGLLGFIVYLILTLE